MEQKKLKTIFNAPKDILGNVTRQAASQVKYATQRATSKPPEPEIPKQAPTIPSYATPTAIARADKQAITDRALTYTTPTQLNRMDAQATAPKSPALPKVEATKPQAPSYATPTAVNRVDTQVMARQAPAYATPTQINRADAQMTVPKAPEVEPIFTPMDTCSIYEDRYKVYYSPGAYQGRIDILNDDINALKQKKAMLQSDSYGSTASVVFARRARGLGTKTVEQAERERDEKRRKIDQIDKQIQGLEEKLQKEATGKKYMEYEALRDAPDFAEKSAYKTTANGREPAMNYFTGQSVETGYDDILYDILNGDETAQKRALNYPVRLYKNVPEGAVELFNYIYATQGKEAAYQYMDFVAKKVYTGAEAIGLGAYQGTGLWPATKTLVGGFGDAHDKERLLEFDAELAEAQRQHPIAYEGGEAGGTVALVAPLYAAGGAIATAAKLPTLASAMLSGGLAFGGSTAVQDAGDLATGQISPGEYFGNVLTGAAAGSASGATSYGLGTYGVKILQKLNLTNNRFARGVMNFVRGGGAATARVGVTEASKYVRDPDGYEFDEGQAVTQVLVSASLDALIGVFSKPHAELAATSQAANVPTDEEALLREVFGENYRQMSAEEIKRAYRSLASTNHPDVVGHVGEETMKRINAAYDIYGQRILGKAQSSWQMATTARVNGDATGYQQAAADFTNSVKDLQVITTAGEMSNPTITEALEILQSVSADMSNAVVSPKAEAPSSVDHVLALAQQADAAAQGKWKTPGWVPQAIRDGMKAVTDLNLAAAKRNALGDLLGYPREVQKNISLFLDKVLADAEDIARWEAMPPEIRQAFQPELDEKKSDLQWLEDYLAKMEEPNGEQKLAADKIPEEKAKLTVPSQGKSSMGLPSLQKILEDSIMKSGRTKGKYWRPKLTSAEWELLHYKMKTAGEQLDEATCWVFAEERGTTIFAFYGIGDGTENTPLYASGGERAVRDGLAMKKIVEELEHGTDEGRKTLDRIFEDFWNQ